MVRFPERKQLHDFRNDHSASLRRITPSTHVGRLSGSHFDIGFQLTQFPGKMVMEPKGEMVGAHEDVSKNGLCTSAVHERAAADGDKGKVYGMKTCNHHESNKTDWNSLLKSFSAGTQIGVPICLMECPQLSSLAAELWIPCCPLLETREKEPFGTGLDTHTHTHGAASRRSREKPE